MTVTDLAATPEVLETLSSDFMTSSFPFDVTLIIRSDRPLVPLLPLGLADRRRDMSGTDEGDALTGSEAADIIRGFGATDVLNGLGGDDTIRGGDGDDRALRGDEGDDRIMERRRPRRGVAQTGGDPAITLAVRETATGAAKRTVVIEGSGTREGGPVADGGAPARLSVCDRNGTRAGTAKNSSVDADIAGWLDRRRGTEPLVHRAEPTEPHSPRRRVRDRERPPSTTPRAG